MNIDADTVVKGGTLLVLCLLVLAELRALRPVMVGVREVLAALLERERIRDARKARDGSGPKPMPKVPEQPEWPDHEDTGIQSIIERQRRTRTPGGGVRAPRPGTHHDE